MTSRRDALRIASLAAGSAAGVVGRSPGSLLDRIRTASDVPASAGATFTRPTGAGYTKYESLYKSGDSVSGACARLTTASIITFPEGTFDLIDFDKGYLSGLDVPRQCRGIWGSGPGNLAGTASGTYLRMKAMTSTKASLVPAQSSHQSVQMRVMKSANSYAGQSFGQFQVRGQEQGHIYHGFTVYQPGGAVTATDILVTGWSGNATGPPGETFGFEISGAPSHTLTRVESDARRKDLVRYGAAPMTAENCHSGTWQDCYGHHSKASSITFFESSGINTYNLRSAYNGTGTGGQLLSGSGINHERTTGIVHHNPSLIVDRSNGNTGVHITFSNDNWSSSQVGSTANGSLTVIAPTFSPILDGKHLYVQSWTPYGNGDTQSSPPTVHTASGSSLPFAWIHGSSRIVSD